MDEVEVISLSTSKVLRLRCGCDSIAGLRRQRSRLTSVATPCLEQEDIRVCCFPVIKPQHLTVPRIITGGGNDNVRGSNAHACVISTCLSNQIFARPTTQHWQRSMRRNAALMSDDIDVQHVW